MTGRQCAKLIAFADEERIGRDHERIGPQLGQGFEYRSEVVLNFEAGTPVLLRAPMNTDPSCDLPSRASRLDSKPRSGGALGQTRKCWRFHARSASAQ